MAFSLKYFKTHSNMPEIFIDITPDYTAKHIFYKNKVKTNAGKQSVSYMAVDIWKDLPTSLKYLSVFVFPKYIKRYLLSEQKQNQFST